MNNDTLQRKLEHYFDGEKASVRQVPIKRGSTALDQVRDAMLDVGVILEEDLDQGIYVARITGGRKRNYGPIIAACPNDEGVEVAGVVVRGKTQPVDEAIQVFRQALEGDAPKPKHRNLFLRFFILFALLAGVLSAFCFIQFVIPAKSATVEYNEAVNQYNEVVPKYNRAVEGLFVGNLPGFVPEVKELSLQGTDYISICRSVVGGNRAEKIVNDEATVRAMTEELLEEIPILNAIRNPSAEWVSKKLNGVDGVNRVEAVSAQNDPNGMLGKDGGYSSCTYFTTGLLGKGVVQGETPVQKGVDGGGAIEAYPTLEDARARCEYLSGFDDSILYSGSYALVGTMVIRTSCLLDDDAQYTLTNNIVSSMTDG